MLYNDKTKEELAQELQDLQQKYASLKASYDKDIANSKQNEINLQISEAHKKAILNGISSNIAFVDKDLKIIWANKTAADSVNKNPDEMIGHTCHHFWADPSKPCENCPSRKVLETKKTESTIMQTDDGRVWEERGEPVFDSEGNLIGVVEIATDITESKQAENENERTRKLLEDSQRIGKIGGWEINIDTKELKWTKEMYNIHEVGPDFELLVDQRINFYTPESLAAVDHAVQRAVEHGESYELEGEIVTAKGNRRNVKSIGKPDLENSRLYGLFQDITERKETEKYRELSRDLLKLLNEPNDLAKTMQQVLSVIKERTGFSAVGIRLKEGEDFPYWQQQGFSPDFLLTENSLLERTAEGNVCRDKNGNVNLECTCGLVISGKTDPANPLFTKGGSCWTNNSIPLLNLPADEDPRLHPRNNCIHNGYASVALVPIRIQNTIIGLIQLNDHRKNCLSLEIVELLEDVASHIGAAFQRIQDADLLKISNQNFKDLSNQLEAILDHIPGLVFYKDKLNNFIRVNKYVAEAYHTSKENLEGVNLSEMYPAPIANQYHQDDLAVINSGVSKLNFEESWDTPEGLKWVNTNKIPFVNANGEIIGILGISMDITEQKAVEAALAQSREELKAIYDNSPVMMSLVDENRNILFANPAFTTLTGTPEEQLKEGKACGVFGCINALEDIRGCGYGADCRNCGLKLAMDDTMKTGASHDNIEYHTTLFQNGETRVVTLLGSTALIESNNERKLLLCLNDITDRKKAEHALSISEHELKRAQEITHIGSWHLDLATNEVHWSDELYKMYGFDPSLPPPPFTEHQKLFTPESWEILSTSLANTAETGIPYDLELKTIKHDGSYGWMRVKGETIQDRDGKTTGMWGAAQDITERKKTEKALSESQEMYRIIVENSVVGVVQTKLNGEVLYVNDAFVKMYEATSSEEFIGKQMTGVYKFEADRNEVLRMLKKDGRVDNFEVVGLTVKGNEKTRLLSAKISGEAINGLVFDITDRKKAEEALRKSELLLREAGHLAKLGGWEIDLATTKLTWTKETYHIHEVSTEIEPNLEDGIRFYAPEAQPILNKTIDRAINHGEPFDLELPFITAKGKHLWVRSIGNVEKANGLTTRIYGVIQDITERKKAEESLKASEEKYRLLTEFTADVIWVINLTTAKFSYISPSVYQLRGFTADEAMLETLEDSLTPDSIATVNEAITKNIVTFIEHPEKPNYYFHEIQQYCKDGSIIWVEVSTQFRKNPKGHIEVVGVSRNIEERKKVAEELHKSNAYLENLINYANAPIIVWDPQFHITRFNHAFENLTGRKELEVLGKSIEILFAASTVNQSMELIRKTQSGERWETVEIEIQHIDGSSRTVLWNSATLFSPDDKTPIATIAQGQDITERKQAEVKLHQASFRLSEAQ